MEMSQIHEQFCFEKPERRDMSEELRIDGKIVLKYTY